MKQIRVLYTGRAGGGNPPTNEQIDVVTPRGAVLHFTQGSATTVDPQDWSYLQRHEAYQFVVLDEPSPAAASAATSARSSQANTTPGTGGRAGDVTVGARPRTEEIRHGR